ncbi:MAG: chromosome segregation protein SMC [Betaproteobacteria bacterium]|nr:chromosome segregation protein SMC [Betaproteobacteria bacterium]
MRLTQIRLSGFKSFVDPTSIHIPGQLVGIVGPNGCGKSNVIDAVRWVLGESRASALRGDSMQDVIFNGSGNRKPLARASVELMFDNSLGRAAGQWSQYAEISVKRVLQRDGESSYQINNVHVRRRDITDMFLGTGLGPRAYAIVEQGTISRVIEAKPDELRVFLEEAAGISRYKERRRETEHRLADTRENLARVNDIRAELGAQIEKLAAQAAVATRYKEHQSELQHRQQLLWFLRRRDAATERERHAQEIARAGNEIEAQTARLRGIETRIEGARREHYRAGDALNAAQAALYAANSELARHEAELRHAEETRQRLEGQRTDRSAQLAAWREQRAQLTQALHMWAARAGGARQQAEEAQRLLDAESGKLPAAEAAFRAAQERLNEARSRLMQAESRLQLEQANLAHLERGLSAREQRRERLEAELATLAAPDAAALTALEARLAELNAAGGEAQRQLESLQSACAELEQAAAAAGQQANEAVREHTAADAQLRTLKQIQAATEDNAPLGEWLGKHRLAGLPRFWQKLRIEAGWETAVEAVLRERLHALELGDPGELAGLYADQPPAKASLFSAGAGAPLAAPPGCTPLAEKVHAAEAGLAGAMTDWFSGIYVAEDVPGPQARAALPPGAVLVNRQGHQFTRHTVSFHAPDPADAGILARQSEIEALEARCETRAAGVAAARARQQAAEAELADRQGELQAARETIAAQQTESHAAQIELLKLNQALERHRERTAQIEGELAEIDRDAQRDRARLAELQQSIAVFGAGIERARSELGSIKAEHDVAEAGLVEQRGAIQRAERAAHDAVFAERECASKISEIDHSVRVIDQQIESAEAEIGKLDQELQVDPIPEIRQALERSVEARIGCERTLGDARDAVEAAAGALRGLEEERLQVDGGIAPLRERLGELRLKEQAAHINFDQLAGQLREAGADEERLAQDAERAPRPSAMQGEITRITQAIEALGAVNLAALDELQASGERKGFLDAQATDLEEAVSTLENAIRHIDRETRALLQETFDSVNRHFGSLFPVLFGGGEARLIMTGEEILDAGVQVMAQPPGKRNSTIHLLSGGEKALTAIALVFALFHLNPAPFCLLDEVDAPLDDSNVERFCQLVRKMSSHTQFLFISHNKMTMEMGEQLIGVTMPESGVSRVVAVDVEQALRIRDEIAA